MWLWKFNNKSKLLALMDQHLPPADASQIRTDLGTTEQSRVSVKYCLNMFKLTWQEGAGRP